MSLASNELRQTKLWNPIENKIIKKLLNLGTDRDTIWKRWSSPILPCNFRLWNRGLPKKLFLILVSRVFHSWPPALLHVDPVITGGGVGTLPPTPECGDPGIAAITAKWMQDKFEKLQMHFWLLLDHGLNYNYYSRPLGTNWLLLLDRNWHGDEPAMFVVQSWWYHYGAVVFALAAVVADCVKRKSKIFTFKE